MQINQELDSTLEVKPPYNNIYNKESGFDSKKEQENSVKSNLPEEGESGNLPDSKSEHALFYGPYDIPGAKVTAHPVNKWTINEEANFTIEVNLDYMIESIRTNGQYNPILLWYNNARNCRRWEVVDGRHRMWACNYLGIEVKTMKLPTTITKEQLPALILDIQLTQSKVPNKNASSAIITRYLAKYGNRTTITAKLLRAKYPNAMLTEKDMSAMKYLLHKEPLWFYTLEMGNGVAPEGTYTKLTSPRALQKLSKERYTSANTRDVVYTDSKDKELAKMFKDIDALISTIGIGSPEKGSQLAYVLAQKTKQLQALYPATEIVDGFPDTYEDMGPLL